MRDKHPLAALPDTAVGVGCGEILVTDTERRMT